MSREQPLLQCGTTSMSESAAMHIMVLGQRFAKNALWM